MSVRYPVSERKWFGEYRRLSVYPTSLVYANVRYWICTPVVSPVITLPDATTLTPGGPIFYLANTHASTGISIEDDGGTQVVVLAAQKILIACLIDNSDADGTWAFIERDYDQLGDARTAYDNLTMWFGGDEDASNAWEYSNVTDTWTERTDGTNNHDYAAGGALVNDAYIIGDSNGYDNDEYDPHAWNAKTDPTHLTTSWHSLMGDAIGNSIYLAGGMDNVTPLDDVYRYTPGIESWIARTAMADGVAYLVGKSDGTDLHYMGGSDGITFAAHREHFIYDVSVNAHVVRSALHWPGRCMGGIAAISTDIWYFGGVDVTNEYLDTDKYIGSTNTWLARTPITGTARYGIGAVANDAGSIIATGGRTAPASAAHDDCVEYHPSLDTFVSRQDATVLSADYHQSTFSVGA